MKFVVLIVLFFSASSFAKKLDVAGKSKKSLKNGFLCKEKYQLSKKFTKDELIICGEKALFISKGKIVTASPINVIWEDPHKLRRNRVKLELVDTPISASQSFVLRSNGDYGDAMSCQQFLTVHNKKLVVGPGLCTAGEGFAREFKIRKSQDQIEIAIIDIDQDLSGIEIKTTTHESEIWSWKENKWVKTFEKNGQ